MRNAEKRREYEGTKPGGRGRQRGRHFVGGSMGAGGMEMGGSGWKESE